MHSILDIVLVLVLFGTILPLVPHVFGTLLPLAPHVLCSLPIHEGQEALHFCSFGGDSDCTLPREFGFSEEFEFGDLLPVLFRKIQ